MSFYSLQMLHLQSFCPSSHVVSAVIVSFQPRCVCGHSVLPATLRAECSVPSFLQDRLLGLQQVSAQGCPGRT